MCLFDECVDEKLMPFERQKNIHIQVCEVLKFKHTDFLKPDNICLYVNDVAAEITSHISSILEQIPEL